MREEKSNGAELTCGRSFHHRVFIVRGAASARVAGDPKIVLFEATARREGLAQVRLLESDAGIQHGFLMVAWSRNRCLMELEWSVRK